jgi:PTS system mannose-specific IIC component
LGELVSISLFGALLMLDTKALFQVLISQPLVACTLIGWLTNDIALGLHIGFLMQLLWLSNLPVGAALVPEGNLASIVAAGLVIQLNHQFGDYTNFIILIAALYALGVSWIGAKIVDLLRNWNILFLDKALKLTDNGKLGTIGILNMWAIVLNYVTTCVTIFISLFISVLVFSKLIALASIEWNIYARYTEMALLGAGVGLTLLLFKENKIKRFIVIGLITGLVLFCII